MNNKDPATPTSAEPAGGDGMPELPKYQEQVWIMGREANRREMAAVRYYTADQMHEYARAYAAGQIAEAEQDAARYRFIRDTPWEGTPLGRVISPHRNALWDSEIDAARARGDGS